MHPNSARLQCTNSFYIVIFGLKSELGSIRFSLETECETQVHVVIDSFCLVSQSNHLKHSNKRCDWCVVTVLCCVVKHLGSGDSIQ